MSRSTEQKIKQIEDGTATEVSFSHDSLSAAQVTRIATALKVSKSLTKLNLGGNRIGDQGASKIADALKVNKSLTELNLGGNHIGDEGAGKLAKALEVNESLTTLNLSLTQIGAEGAGKIADALKVNESLTVLNLWNNQIGDEGAGKIGEALEVNESLTTLSLEYNRISDEGASKIEDALKVNKSLTTLYLNNNQIGAEGAEKIADALKVNKSLTELSLDRNSIGDEGASNIAKALEVNKSLTTLVLRNNRIGDDGASKLRSSASNNVKLYIARNPVRQLLGLAWADMFESYPDTLGGMADTLESPPIHVVRRGACATARYLRQVHALPPSSTSARELRLLFVGHGGVGKTTLCETLEVLGREQEGTDQLQRHLDRVRDSDERLSTHGIHQSPWLTRDVNFMRLDFAGQLEYYAIHRHFLRDTKAIYLVLFSFVDDDGVAKPEPQLLSEIRYWISFIRGNMREALVVSHAPDLARLVVVGTKADLLDQRSRPRSFNRKALQTKLIADFPELKEFLHVCDPLNYQVGTMQALFEQLHVSANAIAVGAERLRVPQIYEQIRERICMAAKDLDAVPVQDYASFRSDLRKWACDEGLDGEVPETGYTIDAVLDTAVEYHSECLGTIVLYPPLSSSSLLHCEYVILSPQWLFLVMGDCVQRIDGRYKRLANERGVVTLATISRHLDTELAGPIVTLLTAFGLCCPWPALDNSYFFPTLLSQVPRSSLVQALTAMRSHARGNGYIFFGRRFSPDRAVDHVDASLFQTLTIALATHADGGLGAIRFFTDAILIGDSLIVFVEPNREYIDVVTVSSETGRSLLAQVSKQIEAVFGTRRGLYSGKHWHCHAHCPECLSQTFGDYIDSTTDNSSDSHLSGFHRALRGIDETVRVWARQEDLTLERARHSELPRWIEVVSDPHPISEGRHPDLFGGQDHVVPVIARAYFRTTDASNEVEWAALHAKFSDIPPLVRKGGSQRTVFVSYAWGDTQVTKTIVEGVVVHLKRAGLHVIHDTSPTEEVAMINEGNKKWMARGIKGARYVCVLLSPTYKRKVDGPRDSNVRFESCHIEGRFMRPHPRVVGFQHLSHIPVQDQLPVAFPTTMNTYSDLARLAQALK